MFVRVLTTVTVVLLLTSCSTSAVDQLAATPAPRSETATGPTLKGESAALGPVRQPVPPVRLQVGAVGIDIPVDAVGVQTNGEMQIPESIDRAGWYQYGSDPESPTGTTVIAAHVDSYTDGIGPFAYLKTLQGGEAVVVTANDGTEHPYTVTSVVTVPRDQLPSDDVFDRDGVPRLILITCGGQYGDGAYTDNVIVVATPQ